MLFVLNYYWATNEERKLGYFSPVFGAMTSEKSGNSAHSHVEILVGAFTGHLIVVPQ